MESDPPGAVAKTPAPLGDVMVPLLVTLALARLLNWTVPFSVPLLLTVPFLGGSTPTAPACIRMLPLLPLIVPALFTMPPLLRITPKRFPSMTPLARLSTLPMVVKLLRSWSKKENIEMPSAPAPTRPAM